MSSTYLTNDDMLIIERLLREAQLEASDVFETREARLLIHAFEEGTRDENALRILLRKTVGRKKSWPEAIDRWDNEGGAAATPMKETQRQIDNDTSGKRRRAKNVQDRNDMH
ncbi:hypothetical protein [Mesorhizobium sp. 8]|uniref:hypothetical protein n=1 Tax=Mesorhizobium sp. 8 TaxID=2584466 RepID=UPI00111D5BE0|nr:hypothetical protein [Mesorhizobium sp. 8]QDC00333.1 hypothetical protein FGU64_07830 [Mesorhizobium sp. 8]